MGSLVSTDTESSLPGPNNKSQKKKTAPTIYYSSRTHSQISQVIREYRKTTYRVPMAVLASRKHLCTNPRVRGKDDLDEKCKLLLKNKDAGCSEFKNKKTVKRHSTFQKGGCHEVHDIQDLMKVGEAVKGCSYYAARSMAHNAQLVFCPYSYIINPVIRRAIGVDIKDAIVIFDEAHNIENIARCAGSVDIEEDTLNKMQMELEQLCFINSLVYQPLYEMTQELTNWIAKRKTTLLELEFQHYVSWTGNHAQRELQEANITQQCFPILLKCATKAIKAASYTESDDAHLSVLSVIALEELFSSLTYFFSRNGCHMSDYQLALQRHTKRDPGKAHAEWIVTLSLWCLNPAVVFRDIGDLSLSVILTSGTLSPMNSFSSELGVQFGTSLEAPHVIDVESQVWPAIISTGPGNHPLNGSYKTADGYAFQDALGKSLEEIFFIAPGGCLVFFPSYELMEKLQKRWSETGQWSRLNARKSLFVEPRGGDQEDFDSILKGYYDTIRLGDNFAVEKKVKPNDSYVVGCENPEGAALLAVFRGKVSEGIDFSDDNARVVIIVGIPFPNINDIQVALKKEFNDTYKMSKNLLSGNEWYCQQAFRALNQAAGRCIRHKFDYGAILLLDERFQEKRNRTYISKWLRKSIKQFDNFEQSMKELKSFFSHIKERISNNTESELPNSENEEHITSAWQSCCRRMQIEKFDIFNYRGQKAHEDVKNCRVNIAQKEFVTDPKTKNPECNSVDRSSIISGNLTCPKDTSYEILVTGKKFNSLNVTQVPKLNDTVPGFLSSGLPRDKKLHLSCALCRSPLGRPENHLNTTCSFTVSSKTNLISIYKERFKAQTANSSASIQLIITDILFVNQRLLVRSSKNSGVSIWSEEDGCVYNYVFCPFCCSDNCIGVQIMATDASNIPLLHKEVSPVSSSAKNKYDCHLKFCPTPLAY
uniref:Regulator of telomere elongation helicase 1 homolog n=1 Tax=Cucumis melo TaxID=3656 RepID=A0A9I9DEW8_CUCME